MQNIFIKLTFHHYHRTGSTWIETRLGSGREMSVAETETRPRRWPHQLRRDRDETFAGLET